MRLQRLFPFFFFLFFVPSLAQTKDTLLVVRDTVKMKVVEVSHWTNKNTVGFDLNQIAFVNWSAGGVSSVSGLLKGIFSRKYDNNNVKWSNELIMRYGMNKQDGVEFRKTDDAFQFVSTFGYRRDTISNWYHSAKFNFNTQFTDGYEYPNTDLAISGAFSPAYTFFGIGAEYSNKEKLINVYLSPMTVKNTIVANQRLANQGAFGVKPAQYDANGNMTREGENMKTEFGMLITCHFKREIFKNINLENRLALYSDYINKFGNIDVDWQLQLDMIVNQYVKANIGTHLLYDDDIKAKEEVAGVQVTKGPRIQLKQMLGIGVEYSF
ncbi:DUF3078 domain-containing protein [Flavobacterium caeni]|uniref:DUF3078 domain-containing protein n=1 Tax=Flavobacterium caeni TaxID=490189 RepID=A0A1G5ILW3_9FLAO|nr:DUF3078 domain-containing protein [Flavobacterium caeni]SCY76987.1 Protein of unknown function [Flavobacterium caeni]